MTAVRVIRRRRGELAERPADVDDPDDIAATPAAKVRALAENPFSAGEHEVAQLLAIAGSRVVGRIDVFPGEIIARATPVPVLWGSALSVAEAYRRTGAGVMLILAMQALGPTVGGCAFSPMAVPVYRGLHWTSFEMRRWLMPLSVRPAIERHATVAGLATVGAAVVDGALRRYFSVRGRMSARHVRAFRVESVERCPDELAQQLAPPGNSYACHRSARWLDWLVTHAFIDDPRDGRRLHLVRDDNGELAGYFVLKGWVQGELGAGGLRRACPVDWQVLSPTLSVRALLTLAVDAARAADVDAVDVYEAECGVEAAARALGMQARDVRHFMFRAGPRSPLRNADANRKEAWRLRPGEADASF